MHDLDAIPFPAWDLVDMQQYAAVWKKHRGYFSINMSTTRGCPFKCNWCAKPIYGNRYNARSPRNVVDEIDMLIRQFGIEHIWFCDDIFGLKPGWIKTFRDEIRARDLKIRYKIQARVDLLLEEEGGEKFTGNIRALAESGCDEVWVGAESGSQNILDAMDKGTKVEQIFTAVRNMQKEGIKPCLFLQFGYPGETFADIRKTINMVNTLVPYDIGISVSYPLPGTSFYERVKNQLQEKQNWDDSDDLAMMYRGSYPPAFYRALHRYVHKRFRVAQGSLALRRLLTFRDPGPRATYRITGLLYFIPASIWFGIRMRMHQRIQKDATTLQTRTING
ncbi:MAG: radical SAM protein [Chitinophagales bacterium]